MLLKRRDSTLKGCRMEVSDRMLFRNLTSNADEVGREGRLLMDGFSIPGLPRLLTDNSRQTGVIGGRIGQEHSKIMVFT